MGPRPESTTGIVGLLLLVVLSVLGLGTTVGVAGADTLNLAPGITFQDAGAGTGHASGSRGTTPPWLREVAPFDYDSVAMRLRDHAGVLSGLGKRFLATRATAPLRFEAEHDRSPRWVREWTSGRPDDGVGSE